jgi:hypothetical protein
LGDAVITDKDFKPVRRGDKVLVEFEIVDIDAGDETTDLILESRHGARIEDGRLQLVVYQGDIIKSTKTNNSTHSEPGLI